MTLPIPILGVLLQFRITFTEPTWKKVLVLVTGALLARGRRTVCSALRAAGHAHDLSYRKYHEVFSRARWSALCLSKILLRALVATFVVGEVTLAIDETLERRRGRRLHKRSHHRDPIASSRSQAVITTGLRWVVVALVAQVPWCRRPWALPFLSRIAPSLKNDTKSGRRHKTLVDHARQMISLIRRWLPGRSITLLGDTTYSALALGQRCRRLGVRLIAPLTWKACLYCPLPDPHAPRQGRAGRPRVVGPPLPKPRQVLADPATSWRTILIPGPDGVARPLQVTDGVAWWYQSGAPPLPLRWVITRDPAGTWESRCYFSTVVDDTAESVVTRALLRWPIEVMFEEARAHLGFETQRQWSDEAIERETPCLLGLYSVVALIGAKLLAAGEVLVQRTAWYHKKEATFADVLAAVRRCLWRHADGVFATQPGADAPENPGDLMDRLVETLCYSH